jgi:hypothetical protein
VPDQRRLAIIFRQAALCFSIGPSSADDRARKLSIMSKALVQPAAMPHEAPGTFFRQDG